MELALGVFFSVGSPRESGLEHSCRADVAIAAPSLRVALVGRVTAKIHRAHPRTIRKYDSGYADMFLSAKISDPLRSLGNGTRRCA